MVKHTQTIWVFDHFVGLAFKGLRNALRKFNLYQHTENNLNLDFKSSIHKLTYLFSSLSTAEVFPY